VYRNPQGTFTRSVTAGFIVALVIMFLVRGKTSLAVPYYGIGVFMPIMVMGFAIRRHILQTTTGRTRKWGSLAAGFAAFLAAVIFVGQIVGKWTEGGWVVLISFSILVLTANAILLSYRRRDADKLPNNRERRVQGAMASIVEQSSYARILLFIDLRVAITLARFLKSWSQVYQKINCLSGR
jgi:hypothetical protein